MPEIDRLPQVQQMEFALLRDMRTVVDIARFYFNDYIKDGMPDWVVQEVLPDYESGAATILGEFFDTTQGKMVVPPEAEVLTLKKGSLKPYSVAQSVQKISGTYSWTEVIGQPKRVLDAEDIYSPFSYGGVLVYKPNPKGGGLDKFLYPRLIFSQWMDMVQPAFAYSMQIGNILDGQGTKSDDTVLMNIINQSNALLSSLALRESLRLELIAPHTCSSLLHGRESNLVSLYVYLMLIASSPQRQSEWLKELLIVVKNSKSPEDLKSLALGAFSAVIFSYQHTEAGSAGITILESIHQHLNTLKVAHNQAEQLNYMFNKSGLY